MVHSSWFMVYSSWFPPYDGGSVTLVIRLGWLALSPCGLATYDMHTEMSSLPTGGLCYPAGKHTGILTYFQTMSTKKWPKKHFFKPQRTQRFFRQDWHCFFRHGFTQINTDSSIIISHGFHRLHWFYRRRKRRQILSSLVFSANSNPKASFIRQNALLRK